MKTKNKIALKRWLRNNLPMLSLFTKSEKVNIRLLFKRLTTKKEVYNHLSIPDKCFRVNNTLLVKK